MMDVINNEEKDGVVVDAPPEAPSILDVSKPKLDGSGGKKKRRRGKSKRKLMKPFMKVSWQDRRKIDKSKRNRFRKIVLAKTQAPFNNNQFLMEIHKPEPENNYQLLQTPARTRDSSFSVDSEENYFYSLPEDEEEYLTKEFSSVYEDAQSERLSNMSKNDLIQEYLLLEAKYDTLIKRTERSKPKYEDDNDITVAEQEASLSESMMTDKDTSGTSSTTEEPTIVDLMQRMKQQEEQIRELQIANEKLRLENERLHQRSPDMSSEDSESDSSSTSGSSSSCSSRSISPAPDSNAAVGPMDADGDIESYTDGNGNQNGETEHQDTTQPVLNGFHSPNE